MDQVSENILYSIEYIPGIFYFATARPGRVIADDVHFYLFTTDDELVYQNFYSDFGPLNLGCVYKYCCKLNEIFRIHLRKRKVVHYTSTDPKKKANAAFLIGCYGVLCLDLAPRDAFRALCSHGQTYKPFQDATPGDSLYTITILDCLNAICSAKNLGLINLQDFDVQEYDRLDNIRGGDLNWIVPDKFLAFIGPVDHALSPHPPDIYLGYFLENDVRIVIRLNKKYYNEQVFEAAGIKHYDMIFPDGSCPPRHIVCKFLQIAEENPGVAIAVHCKAGLGRTGSLIGCYLIKHYRMSARESIAWMRICRPGSVIGHQQGWLEQLEPWLAKEGNLFRKKVWNDRNKLPYHEFGLYSLKKRKWLEERIDMPDVSPRESSQMTKSPPNSSPHTPKLITEDTFVKIEKLSDERSKRRGSPSARNSTNERRIPNEPRRDQYFANKNSNNYNIDTAHRIGSKNNPNGKIPKPRGDTQAWKPGMSMTDRNRSRLANDSPNRMIRIPPQPKQSRGTASHLNNTPLQCNVVPGLPSDFVMENITSCIRGANKEALGTNRSNRNRSPSPLYKREKASSKEVTIVTTPEIINSPQQNKPKVMQTRTSNLRIKALIKRDRSIGAASLDARRNLGTPDSNSRSVKSDDQTRITQGDYLNSIKFERQLRRIANRNNKDAPAGSGVPSQEKRSKISEPIRVPKQNERIVVAQMAACATPAKHSRSGDRKHSPRVGSSIRTNTLSLDEARSAGEERCSLQTNRSSFNRH